MRDFFFAVQDTLEAIGARLQAIGDALPKIWKAFGAVIFLAAFIAVIVVAFLIGCAVQDDIAPPTVTPQPASREAG